SGFTDAPAVYFGTASSSLVFATDTIISAMSPSASAGPVDITVVSPEGTSTATTTDTFNYIGFTPLITNATSVPPQNVATSTPNQPLGGFTINVVGEPINIHGSLFFQVATSTGADKLTNVFLVDQNGNTVGGPADETWFPSPPGVLTTN